MDSPKVPQSKAPPPPPPPPAMVKEWSGESGGIFIASNIADSTRVWNCKVTNDKIIGKNGNIDPMREFLPTAGVLLEPGKVYWMNDRAPHESLPMKVTTMRQFFRIMTSEVEFWFKDLYTANPLGVLPDPNVTEMVVGKDSSAEDLKFLQDWKSEGFEQMMRIENERETEMMLNSNGFDVHDGEMMFNCVVDGANRNRYRRSKKCEIQ